MIVSALIGVCLILMIFLFITDSLSQKRKRIIFAMVLTSMMLILSEQMARVFNGNMEIPGFYITRISKLANYLLSLINIYIFSIYLKDILKMEGEEQKMPKSLIVMDFVLLAGVVTTIISQFTKIYYYYDDNNVYHRNTFIGFPMFIPASQLQS